jgi:hypothetical protein
MRTRILPGDSQYSRLAATESAPLQYPRTPMGELIFVDSKEPGGEPRSSNTSTVGFFRRALRRCRL